MEVDTNSLIAAYVLDGQGGAKQVYWEEVREWKPGSDTIWVHLDRTGSESQRWIYEDSGLDSVAGNALLAHSSRPRYVPHANGLLLDFRGVNLNPGANPDDMVSIKIWAEPGRVISSRHRHLEAIEDIRETLKHESLRGPRDVGDLIVGIADRLIERMDTAIDKLERSLDKVETEIATAKGPIRESRLPGLRSQAIGLRRYIAPQRELLSRLVVEETDLLDQAHRIRIRELDDRVTRLVEDLDAVRERATVMQDRLAQLHSERMERTMLVLSVIAAVFLPLGLLTGLLGINTGGIPGAGSDLGFAAVAVILVFIAALEVWIFHKAHWF